MRSKRSFGWVGPALAALGWCVLPAEALAQEAGEAQAAPAEAPAFDATLLRTWTSDEANSDLTIVDGLAQVPLAMMAGGTTGTYRFELTVFDSDDTQLYRDSWERTLSDRAAAYAGAEASTMLEPFRFGVRPGEYIVEIRAYPTDAPDLGARARLPVGAYTERPVASDLFLADRVEALDADGGGSWSITHGGFGISAVAHTTVLPQEPRLYYYLELYGTDVATEAELTAEVVNESGRVLYTTPPSVEQVPVGGSPVAGTLSLEGLPPGSYDLRLAVTDATGATTREAPFRMLDAAVARSIVPKSYEAEYFASLSDAELESTFGGVAYLSSETERQTYDALPMDAKRRYLTEYFARRNPTIGGASNSYLQEYIDRVGTVRAKYGELIGTGERAPWTTDAGRVYIKYGEPSERLIDHFPSGADTQSASAYGTGRSRGAQVVAPYEAWSYHSTGFVYLFIQENQFGVWRMIFTNDPNMRSLPDWVDRVGQDAVDALARQFGIQPRF